jgi:hypothetical protein
MEDKINRTNYIIYYIFLPMYKDKAKYLNTVYPGKNVVEYWTFDKFKTWLF